MIRTERLTKKFGDFTAVESLDLEVREGEILALLGPNGAGKTTTIRMLAALIAPTSGTATVCGHSVGQASTDIRRSVGLLTEVPGLYESLTARHNLEIFARLHGLSNGDAAIEKYLRLLGLWERRDSPAGTLSKGMKQKLAIARSLIHEPQVLFLDEPTSGLDPQTARSLREFIESLREQGRTVILCTHNLDEAERLCDRVALIQRRLVAVGEPRKLKGALGNSSVHVRVRSLSESARSALRNLPFVSALDGEGTSLSIGLADPEEDTPRLVRWLVEQDVEVLAVEPAAPTLEELYLQLISGGGEA